MTDTTMERPRDTHQEESYQFAPAWSLTDPGDLTDVRCEVVDPHSETWMVGLCPNGVPVRARVTLRGTRVTLVSLQRVGQAPPTLPEDVADAVREAAGWVASWASARFGARSGEQLVEEVRAGL